MENALKPLSFKRGPAMSNRFALAPMTNVQSHPDGTLSDDEYHWLIKRAAAGFGMTMTCAASITSGANGFPGNLGAYSNAHLPGLRRLASGIREHGSVAVLQLYHAGSRVVQDGSGHERVSPSKKEAAVGARAMSTREVEGMIEDFVLAAQRAETAGFDGVELHGAHGYLLGAFLSPELNDRDDAFGGSLENRARPIRDVIAGIRARCGPQFNLGLRLSAEQFGLRMAEMRSLAQEIMTEGAIDYLDMSLWDAFKEPVEEEFHGRSLLSWFTELDRGDARLGVAGKIMSASDVRLCIDAGADFVFIGRGAILHHDFPMQAMADPDFRAMPLPVTRTHLAGEGLGPAFIDYLSDWPGFIEG